MVIAFDRDHDVFFALVISVAFDAFAFVIEMGGFFTLDSLGEFFVTGEAFILFDAAAQFVTFSAIGNAIIFGVSLAQRSGTYQRPETGLPVNVGAGKEEYQND